MTGTQTTTRGLKLRNVRKTFGDTVAVDGVDLTIDDGELLVLLGPSGCGKTTTLRMIAGLEVPTDGTIVMNGTDITETLPQERDLSMVFQNYALYPHKTVEENLAFPLGKMDLSDEEKKEKIAYATELLGIEDLLDKKPGQLSGGQRQRVALGRTIVREPSLFLMDEPLSNLDAKLRVNTRSELRDLQQSLETTTVYVTHDQEEAMSIADRIVIMSDGEIQQIGTPKEVYTKPNSHFVASFLGEPGMNFLPATSDPGESVHLREPVDVNLGLEAKQEANKIGVRPQDLEIHDDSGHESTDRITIEAMRVETIDPLGHAYEVVLERNGQMLVALVETAPYDLGQQATVSFDRSAVHVFADDGAALEVTR
ncbi:ABC transporter ATP-binding protein [Natrialbaceae archaeon A-CW3]